MTAQNAGYTSQQIDKSKFQKTLTSLEAINQYKNHEYNDLEIAQKIWAAYQDKPEALLEISKDCTLPGGSNLAELLDKLSEISSGTYTGGEVLTQDGLTMNPSFW